MKSWSSTAYDLNYTSLEDDADADGIIKDLMDPKKQWVAVFKSEAAATQYLNGQRPIPSQMGLVVKDIISEEGKVTGRKKRLILDAKISLVNEAVTCSQRVVTPRPLDAVDDVLHMLFFAEA